MFQMNIQQNILLRQMKKKVFENLYAVYDESAHSEIFQVNSIHKNRLELACFVTHDAIYVQHRTYH